MSADTVLEAIESELAGDLNGDGFVGIEDLNLILGHWNQTVTPGLRMMGDPDGDGFVGIADLNTVLGNWNAGAPLGGEVDIPEPGSVLLMVSVIVVVSRRG